MPKGFSLPRLRHIRAAPQRARAVDIDQFAALYRHHIDEVYAFMHYYARNHFEAEDLTADVFERALRYFHSFDPVKGEFRSWLFAICGNVVKHHWHRRNLNQPDDPADVDALAAAAVSPEESSLYTEERHRLHEALTGLPDRHFRIVALKFGGGLTNREIARVTGFSESNVGSILNRSLKKIAGILA